jgi:uncharacterized protein YndB with AHSA1/START domain
MSVDITAETIIDRPRDRVAAFVMDPRNDPIWIGGILEARQETEGPFGEGTRVARVASFLGRRMQYTPVVVAYQPGQRLVMQTDKPFPMTIAYTFEDAVGGGTRTSVRVEGDGSGFYRLAAPLLATMVRRNVQNDLETLKGLLEADFDRSASLPYSTGTPAGVVERHTRSS